MLSKEKRKQEKDFIEIRAKELGRLEVQKEILGNTHKRSNRITLVSPGSRNYGGDDT